MNSASGFFGRCLSAILAIGLLPGTSAALAAQSCPNLRVGGWDKREPQWITSTPSDQVCKNLSMRADSLNPSGMNAILLGSTQDIHTYCAASQRATDCRSALIDGQSSDERARTRDEAKTEAAQRKGTQTSDQNKSREEAPQLAKQLGLDPAVARGKNNVSDPHTLAMQGGTTTTIPQPSGPPDVNGPNSQRGLNATSGYSFSGPAAIGSTEDARRERVRQQYQEQEKEDREKRGDVLREMQMSAQDRDRESAHQSQDIATILARQTTTASNQINASAARGLRRA